MCSYGLSKARTRITLRLQPLGFPKGSFVRRVATETAAYQFVGLIRFPRNIAGIPDALAG